MAIPTDRVLARLDEHLRKNDYAAAKRHLTYWLTEAEQSEDLRGELLISNELMGLCRKLGECEEAFSHADRALMLIERMQIEENVGAATTYLNSATVCKAFGRADQAIPLFKRALKIYERELLASDERLGGLYNNMGLAFVDLGRFIEADVSYQKALAVMQGEAGREPEAAITYLNIASAREAEYGLEGAKEAIAECAEKAMELFDSCKERNDGDYAYACEKCAAVFGYYGYTDYENELLARCRRIYEGA